MGIDMTENKKLDDEKDNHQPHQRDLTLQEDEAEAGGAFEGSVAGEEDPGSALEDLVEQHRQPSNKPKRD